MIIKSFVTNQKDIEQIWDSDYTFWAGDLNFRLDCKILIKEKFEYVIEKIESN